MWSAQSTAHGPKPALADELLDRLLKAWRISPKLQEVRQLLRDGIILADEVLEYMLLNWSEIDLKSVKWREIYQLFEKRESDREKFIRLIACPGT